MRNMTCLVSIAALGLLPLLASTQTHAQELRIDGFESGQSVGFQAGFVAGEMGAVRLTPPTNDTYRVDAITLLFGPSPESRNVTVRIYEDSAYSGDFDPPGTQLFTGNYTLLGSANQLSVIDVSQAGIQVDGTFRVAIQFNHDGDPAIARDDDGTVDSTRNFIFAEGFGWVTSSFLGVAGDWVIRARVRNLGGGEEDAGPPVDAGPADAGLADAGNDDAGLPFDAGEPFDAGAPFDAGEPFDAGSPFDAGAPTDAGAPLDAGDVDDDAGAPPEDAGTPPVEDGGISIDDAGAAEPDPEPAGEPEGEPDAEPSAEPAPAPDVEPEDRPCALNSDCLNGSYCGDEGICTQDCRIDTDCSAGDVCDVLGRCVEETEVEIPEGCVCVAPASGGRPLWALALIGALGFAVRRRRRSQG